jgi:hypothetical protein
MQILDYFEKLRVPLMYRSEYLSSSDCVGLGKVSSDLISFLVTSRPFLSQKVLNEAYILVEYYKLLIKYYFPAYDIGDLKSKKTEEELKEKCDSHFVEMVNQITQELMGKSGF